MSTHAPVETRFASPFSSLSLHRYPRQRGERLRAWDGADSYLLDLAGPGPALILNDACGALALSCPGSVSVGDSWLARAAMEANADDNHLMPASWCWPEQSWPRCPRVLMRVPKQMALLEDQLYRLVRGQAPGTPVWLAWMDKHLPPRLLERVEAWLGPVERLRGRFKAHGVRGVVPVVPPPLAPPEPGRVLVPELPGPLIGHPGVFSAHQLDLGARTLLPHVPSGLTGQVADLGCGNGVLGLVAARRNPRARVWCCDESSQAVRSARDNADALALPVRTHLGDGLAGLQEPLDLVLLNPPFHQGHALDDGVARRLFRQSARRLRPGGELRVVANRHLAYARPLSRLFGQVQVLDQNAKFIVWLARDPRGQS